MNGEVQIQQRQGIKPKTITILLIAFIIIMLSVASFFSYSVLSDSRIYKGVAVNGEALGGLTRQEASDKLSKSFKDELKDASITIKAGDNTKILAYKDIKAVYDIEKAADEAYSTARSGNVFSRLYRIFITTSQGKDIELKVTYDKKRLEAAASEFYNATLVNVKEPEVLVTDEKVTINSGHKGKSIDNQALIKSVEGMVLKAQSGSVEPAFLIAEQGKLNVDDLYAQINRDPVNASYAVKNNAIEVTPHITGRSVDKSALAGAVDTVMQKEDSEVTLPVKSVIPEITTESAQSQLFKDTLSGFSTHFSVSDENNRNRGANIRIAVSKINGKILAPGEIFSFNETVGPRTEDGGFKAAHTYVAGKIVNGIGGGICQVSSTLYNTVLLSDLEVVERRNHMFTVSYVPYGTDATVSYGDVDFKFKNNTKHPIRIEAGVTDNNNIHFSLIGTRETPGKTVVITPKTLKTMNFNTKYIDDPNMAQGKTLVKQKGMKGYVVETYKVVKQDGVVVSNVKLHTSTYRTLDQVVLRGTKKASATITPTAPPAETTAPADASTGVDDADNPPAE